LYEQENLGSFGIFFFLKNLIKLKKIPKRGGFLPPKPLPEYALVASSKQKKLLNHFEVPKHSINKNKWNFFNGISKFKIHKNFENIFNLKKIQLLFAANGPRV